MVNVGLEVLSESGLVLGRARGSNQAAKLLGCGSAKQERRTPAGETTSRYCWVASINHDPMPLEFNDDPYWD